MTDFVWDPAKATSNLAKHGVSFSSAQSVFDDPNALLEVDDTVPFEDRWRTIGMTPAGILFVVSTEPEDNTIRIISARKVNRHEQNRYLRQALP